MSDNLPDRYLTRREVADYLSIKSPTLELWARKKKGPPFVKIGGAVRYSLEKLNKWIEDQSVNMEK